MKQFMQTLMLFFCTAFICACDGAYSFEYYVRNRCDESILIDYTTLDFDSTLVIKPNSEELIYLTPTRIGGGNGPHEPKLTGEFRSIIITRNNDTSKTDFLENEHWHFRKNDAIGIMKANVTNEDF